MLKKPIRSAIKTILFYYSGDMYNWSSLVAKKSFTSTLKIVTNLGKFGFFFLMTEFVYAIFAFYFKNAILPEVTKMLLVMKPS